MIKKFTIAVIAAFLFVQVSVAQSISGTVIYDPNNNNTFDGNDFAMPAIKLYLYQDNNNNNLNDINERIDSTNTDAYGNYSFDIKGTLRTFSINNNADDANERVSNGSMDVNDDRLRIVRDGTNCSYAGLRFSNFNLVPDSISYAQIRFYTRDDAFVNGTTVTIN